MLTKEFRKEIFWTSTKILWCSHVWNETFGRTIGENKQQQRTNNKGEIMRMSKLFKVIIPAAIAIGVMGIYSKALAFALLISGAVAFVVYWSKKLGSIEETNED